MNSLWKLRWIGFCQRGSKHDSKLYLPREHHGSIHLEHMLITRPRRQLVLPVGTYGFKYWVCRWSEPVCRQHCSLPTAGSATAKMMCIRKKKKRERERLWRCVLCLGVSAECQAKGHHNYHRLIISHFDMPMIALLIKCTISSWETTGRELMCSGTYLVSPCWVASTSVCVCVNVCALVREREIDRARGELHSALNEQSGTEPCSATAATHTNTLMHFSLRKTSRSGRMGRRKFR